MKRLSVIMPAFNCANGLRKTAPLVLKALGRIGDSADFWIVDDGSVDDTASIADEFAANDKRVHVIHQENRGCYQARLAALKLINSRYFGFVDADDEVDEGIYETMLNYAESNNLDVVECGYDFGRQASSAGLPVLLTDRQSILNEYILPTLVKGLRGGTFVWNKIYRNTYDFASFYPTNKLTTFEDMIYNLQFFEKVSRYGRLPDSFYHYIISSGSSVRRFSQKTMADFEEAIRFRNVTLAKYGFGKRSLANMTWLMVNGKNALLSAIRSHGDSFTVRISKVWQVLNIIMENM